MHQKIKTVRRFTYTLKLFTSDAREDDSQVDKLIAIISHDESGNIIHEVRYNDDGETEEEKKLIYNKDGKVLSEELILPLDEVQELIKRVYDERGRLTERIKYYSGEEGEKAVYEYENHDQPVRSSHYDADGELERQEEYDYNEKQELTRLTIKEGVGKVAEIHIFAYDHKGNMVEEKESDAEGNLVATVTYEYNDSGKPLRMIHQNADGKLMESFVATYDENDKLIERKVRGSHPGIFSYVYDDRGNCIEESVTDAFGIPLSKSTYEFNENNVLTGDVHYRFDPSRGNRDANYGNRYQYEFY